MLERRIECQGYQAKPVIQISHISINFHNYFSIGNFYKTQILSRPVINFAKYKTKKAADKNETE